jgi:hypothetical protein
MSGFGIKKSHTLATTGTTSEATKDKNQYLYDFDDVEEPSAVPEPVPEKNGMCMRTTTSQKGHQPDYY